LERSWKSRHDADWHSLSLVPNRESEPHFVPKLIAKDIVPLPKRLRNPVFQLGVVFFQQIRNRAGDLAANRRKVHGVWRGGGSVIPVSTAEGK
jgi:hypothetical protein